VRQVGFLLPITHTTLYSCVTMSEDDLSTKDDSAALEQFVVDNDDLLTLEERIGRFNIFDALGIVRAEIRHSNFLAWLLDPAESHGQGSLFLNAILMDLLSQSSPEQRPFSPIKLDGASLQGVEIRREWRNIDILIKCDNPAFVIAIENKIDAGTHNPFEKYEKAVNDAFADRPRMFVFLTTEGDALEDHDWVSYSYADIYRVLYRIRRTHESAIGDDVLAFLDHYLRLIGSRFMDDPKIDELCQTIYKNHRQALQLIFERIGSPAASILQDIEHLIRNDPRWIITNRTGRLLQFFPTAWENLLPPIGNRKKFDPTRWLVVEIRFEETFCSLLVRVWPTIDQALRREVIDRLIRDKNEFGMKTNFKDSTKIGDKWTTLRKTKILSWKDNEEPDENKLAAKITKMLSSVHEQLLNVPDALRPIIERWKREGKSGT